MIVSAGIGFIHINPCKFGINFRKEITLMPDLNFTDRVVIVTGAGGSLGKAYALEFAKRGASVVVNDLGTTQDGSFARSLSANTTVAEIKFHGGKAVPNFDSVVYGHKIIEAAIEHFGRIDVVVNNAGIVLDKSFQNMSDNDWGCPVFDI